MTRFLPFTALLLLASCAGQPGTWGWYVVDPTTANGWVNIKFLLRGFSSTIQVSLLAAFASIVIGLLIATLFVRSAISIIREASREMLALK